MGRFLRAVGVTDVGQEREHNEDSFGLMPRFDLFMVADGMGGHRAGDVASRMAVQAVEEFFTSTEKEDITWPFHFDPNLPFTVNRLVTAVQVANSRIYQASLRNAEHQGMGTTAVAILFVENRASCHIAHVGDSRCYRLRQNVLELITMDHSLINDYLRAAPDLTPEQIAELPRNVITRALGMQEAVQVDVQTHPTQPGDLFLLCSDGLNGMITDEAILAELMQNRHDLGAAGAALVRRANEAGGDDNVTTVIVEVAEEEAP